MKRICNTLPLPASLAALLLLGACNDDPEVIEQAGAEGEILQRSVTDEMLPLDQLQSRAPLAEPEEGEEGAGNEDAEEEAEAAE